MVDSDDLDTLAHFFRLCLQFTGQGAHLCHHATVAGNDWQNAKALPVIQDLVRPVDEKPADHYVSNNNKEIL